MYCLNFLDEVQHFAIRHHIENLFSHNNRNFIKKVYRGFYSLFFWGKSIFSSSQYPSSKNLNKFWQRRGRGRSLSFTRWCSTVWFNHRKNFYGIPKIGISSCRKQSIFWMQKWESFHQYAVWIKYKQKQVNIRKNMKLEKIWSIFSKYVLPSRALAISVRSRIWADWRMIT